MVLRKVTRKRKRGGVGLIRIGIRPSSKILTYVSDYTEVADIFNSNILQFLLVDEVVNRLLLEIATIS